MIRNHVCASLSDLDLQMAAAIPPGGNWRQIPLSIPSKRLEQIRASVAAGQGSRSTYYGRLHGDRPAYTIGTYYNRPGNGCFLHYDANGGQHRTLSHREAARLQSFPDAFSFSGPQRAICQQIGNAVPPLLALQIANALGEPGYAVDVFCGAGGLSLGFEWAGWKTAIAVDFDKHAVSSFNDNIARAAFTGDLTEGAVINRVVEAATGARRGKLALLGGPPCQGFSTGGNRRSTADARNHLHEAYAVLLERLKPDVFVFENVLGILSLDGGAFFQRVMKGLTAGGYEVLTWRLNAANFGIPQRRERVILVGFPKGAIPPVRPAPWTGLADSIPLGGELVCSVHEAIGDLPALLHGEDGSERPYRGPAGTAFQQFARAQLLPSGYVALKNASHDSNRRSSTLRAVAPCP